MTYSGEGCFLSGRTRHEGVARLYRAIAAPVAVAYGQFLFASGTPVTIRHWQLRDLVAFGASADDLYAVHGTAVVRYHVPPAADNPSATLESSAHQAATVMNTGFHASCMTYAYGYIAAGGQSGELDVRDVRQEGEAGVLYRGSTEGSVNNALHIAPSTSGQDAAQLFVCNNDSTIKVYRLPDMYRQTTIQTVVPANYAALSPDGRLLCTVGDCMHGTIYAVTESGYQQSSTFDEASDSGMGCCWAPGGSCLAAAFQDGTVLVWDHRAGKSIRKYSLQSAARCIKFSPAPLDLLAFTENEDFAHVVDMRRWDVMQHLRVARDGSSSGLDVLGSESSMGMPSPPARAARTPSLFTLMRQRQGTPGLGREVLLPNDGLAVRSVGGAARRPATTYRMFSTSDPDGVRVMMEPSSSGTDIAGLSWSWNGARLAVGTDQAAVTFEVDLSARRQFACGALA